MVLNWLSWVNVVEGAVIKGYDFVVNQVVSQFNVDNSFDVLESLTDDNFDDLELVVESGKQDNVYDCRMVDKLVSQFSAVEYVVESGNDECFSMVDSSLGRSKVNMGLNFVLKEALGVDICVTRVSVEF